MSHPHALQVALPVGLLLAAAPLALSQADGSTAPSASARAQDATDEVDFLRDVSPILSDHCYSCHGPDEETREADLRLDTREDMLADRGGYAALVPGDVEASELLLRVLDADDPMPPEGVGEPMSEEEKQVLVRWVEQGAEWPTHWAFETPRRPEPPQVESEAWVRDALDRFVLSRLEQAGLEPEAEASREAWLRRASFDLIGLPPTPEELDAFLADESAEAYEKAVDRLLASEHYGEQRAQEWLDLARYADTNGNQFDEPRTHWKWRDWVIEAFNENKPYDEFTVEQLAGDLLPNPTVSQLLATGFNRNHQTDTDQPAEFEEYRTEYVIDRLDTTATTWMGLTLACAQCHDHKYDPLTQEEFYSFYAFFNDVAERDVDFGNPRPRMYVPSPDEEPLLSDLDERIAVLEERLEADDAYLDGEQARWEETRREELADASGWDTLEPVGMLSRNGARLRLQDDGSVLATGPTPAVDTYDLVLQPGKRTIEALRLEVLPDESREDGASGRSQYGTFRLQRLEIREGTLSDSETPPLTYMALAQADIVQPEPRGQDVSDTEPTPGDIADAIAYSDEEGGGGRRFGGGGWTLVGDARGERHEAVLVPLEPLELNDSSILRITMAQSGSGRATHSIARFRWSATDDSRLRAELLPVAPKLWSTLGPWPAESALAAFAEEFAPEEEIEDGIDRKRRYPEPPPVERPEASGPSGPAQGGPAPQGQAPTPDAEEDDSSEERGEDAPDARERESEREADGADEPAGRRAADEREGERNAEGGEPEDREEPREADGDEKDEPEAEPAPQEQPQGGRRRRRPREITWEEQREWEDGERQSLEIQTGAMYLTRKVQCERAATAELRLDGPAGVKLWVNGELVFEEAPDPPPAPRSRREGAPAQGEDEEQEFDFEAFFGGRRDADAGERLVRIGLRAGENEIVVKAVYQAAPQREGGRRGGFGGGDEDGDFDFDDEEFAFFFARRGNRGASITFDLTPQGAHILTHEVASALRAELPRADAWEHLTTTRRDETEMGPSLGVERIEARDPQLLAAERMRLRLRTHYRQHVSPIGRALHEELERLKEEREELVEDMPEAMVMADREIPRQAYVFERGDWRRPGAAVSSATPAMLPPMDPELPRNRLGLARWLVSDEHPLTARVAVNRIWQHYFGTGIVESAEDFGLRASTPSHPELLDWLATEFVASGWDMKAMHKRIVLSATYRQAAVSTPEKLEADPDNRLLSRGPRTRLSAEMIRDNALYVSELLNLEEVGGESVKPYQAPGLWPEVFGGGRDWRKDDDEDQYRRGLYVYWRRRMPYPAMVAFDATKGETCIVRRPETNTPTQALILLNNPVYVEAAKMLGQRLLQSSEEDAERLTLGFRLCTSRAPSATELEILQALLAEQRAHYAEDEEGAAALLEVGDAEVDEDLDALELAAWAQVASALLNLDATIHKG